VALETPLDLQDKYHISHLIWILVWVSDGMGNISHKLYQLVQTYHRRALLDDLCNKLNQNIDQIEPKWTMPIRNWNIVFNL